MPSIVQCCKLRTLIPVLGFMALTACGGGATTNTANLTTPVATVTFIHLNDLHAHLTPHNDYRLVNGSKIIQSVGGLARIAGLIDQIRASNPNSILMNIGDTYHGGVEALYTQGNAIVAPVNALGIDVGVPGNWDYAYGPAVTRARYTGDTSMLPAGNTIERPNFPNLAANVTYNTPPHKGEPFLPPTYVKDINGVRIGFIGISSDIVPRMAPILALGLDFLQNETDYVNLIQKLSTDLKAQGANMVVVMSELGIHKDYKLANEITPGSVDVFFSAHTHETSFTPLVSNSGTWVMEAGNDTWLGRLDVEFANGKIINKTWHLLDVNSSIPPSAPVAALVDSARATFIASNVAMTAAAPGTTLHLDEPITTVVGHVSAGMDRRNALSNTFNAAYSQMLRSYTGTTLGMTPGFRFDAVIPAAGINYEDPAVVAGEVTVEDAYRFFPVPFTVATGTVTGARLQQIIEGNLTAVFSTDIFQQAGGWFDGYAGLNLTVNLANPDGTRISDLRYTATLNPIPDNDVITMTGCSKPFDKDSATTLCSYDGFTNVTDVINPATSSPWSGVEFLIYGLKNNLLQVPATTNVIDSNNTALWPQGDFYQPLTGVK